MKHREGRLKALLALVLICTSFSFAKDGPAQTTVTRVRDLAYKEGPALTEYERSRCKLDLYLPEKGRNVPVLVWFHGGGLTEGSKDGQDMMGSHFASRGIAVAMVNYRLSPMAKYPDYNRDAAAAVVWVSKHIAQYGGRPDALFVGGHSAGAYLTMIVGMDASYLKAACPDGVPVAGLIPLSGQMATHYTVRAERGDTGLGMRVDEAAPLNHVHKGLPPILNICAEGDDWKRLAENRLIQAYFKAEGIPDTELHLLPGRNHGTIFTRMDEPGDEVAMRIQSFIERCSAKKVTQ